MRGVYCATMQHTTSAPWWAGETAVRLSDVPALLPLRAGRRVSVATVYRWASPAGTYGIRLRRYRAGPRGWCTTHQELQRYLAAVTAACGGDT